MVLDHVHVRGRAMRFYGPNEKDLQRYCGEVIENEEYGPLVAGEDLVVVDLGACLGTFAAWISDRARRVYCVEPLIDNIIACIYTFGENSLENISLFNFAIAGESGTRKLTENGDCGSATILDLAHFDENSTSFWVRTLTLDAFLTQEEIPHVDVLKVDVEGAEIEIFSAPDFPAAAAKCPYIIGEVHDQRLGDILRGHGYDYQEHTSSCGSHLFSARRPS